MTRQRTLPHSGLRTFPALGVAAALMCSAVSPAYADAPVDLLFPGSSALPGVAEALQGDTTAGRVDRAPGWINRFGMPYEQAKHSYFYSSVNRGHGMPWGFDANDMYPLLQDILQDLINHMSPKHEYWSNPAKQTDLTWSQSRFNLAFNASFSDLSNNTPPFQLHDSLNAYLNSLGVEVRDASELGKGINARQAEAFISPIKGTAFWVEWYYGRMTEKRGDPVSISHSNGFTVRVHSPYVWNDFSSDQPPNLGERRTYTPQ